MVNHVSKHKKQQPRRDHRENTMKRVHETKVMRNDKTAGANRKQYTPGHKYQRTPRDASRRRFACVSRTTLASVGFHFL